MSASFDELLEILYEPAVARSLSDRIGRRLSDVSFPSVRNERWSASDIVFITYADAFKSDEESPLRCLHRFLKERLPGLATQVHLLPFFPYTSDDGFAVSDYRNLNPSHGSWDDIRALSQDHELMFDLVINHASSQHPFFQDFLADRAPGNRYFKTAEEGQDVSQVTRPRASPLLQTFDTKSGPKQVWCTFSRDQVDWDFANPEVLYEFVDLFVSYVERGATWMRVDAIAFLWKTVGTSCVHLPQTHAVVKLFRAIVERVAPDFKILTETNVPLAENLSYFGDGDEAHIVYNFSLPPLLTHSLLIGDSTHLTRWCQSLPSLPEGCTFLNFTASHDGIGVRPAEGILTDAQIKELTDCVSMFGGRVNQRQRADGSLGPYEANVSLFDAFKGTVDGEDAWQVERFLSSQGVMMALAGVPALYYNSVLAAPNHHQGFAETGRNRTINRRKWTIDEVNERLSDAKGTPARVLEGIRTLVETRRQLDAFHPEASQECCFIDQRLFVITRRSRDESQTVICVFNLTKYPVSISKSSLGMTPNRPVTVHYQSGTLSSEDNGFELAPYAMIWLE